MIASKRELTCAQHTNLQFTDQFVCGILVDHDHVSNAFDAISEPKGTQRLVVVYVGWRECGDHHRLTITAERVLQQFGENRFSIGHHDLSLRTRRYISQCRDHIAQSRQRPIDVRAFLQAIARGSRA